jgi:hypothetical protein
MYERDIRHIVHTGPPEAASRRLAAFRHGWTDAIQGQEYQPDGLREVKWQNLGWRFGGVLGHVSATEQEGIFDLLVELQVAERVNDTEVANE